MYNGWTENPTQTEARAKEYYAWKAQRAICNAMVAAVNPKLSSLLNAMECIEQFDGKIDPESLDVINWTAPIEEGCGNDDMRSWLQGGH